MATILLGVLATADPVRGIPGRDGPEVLDLTRCRPPRGRPWWVYWQHNLPSGRAVPIGQVVRHWHCGDCLRGELVLYDNASRSESARLADTVAGRIRNWEVSGLSVGYRTGLRTRVPRGAVYYVCGQRRIATSDLTLVVAEFHEVSLAESPADARCYVYSVGEEEDSRPSVSPRASRMQAADAAALATTGRLAAPRAPSTPSWARHVVATPLQFR